LAALIFLVWAVLEAKERFMVRSLAADLRVRSTVGFFLAPSLGRVEGFSARISSMWEGLLR